MKWFVIALLLTAAAVHDIYNFTDYFSTPPTSMTKELCVRSLDGAAIKYVITMDQKIWERKRIEVTYELATITAKIFAKDIIRSADAIMDKYPYIVNMTVCLTE